MCHDSFMRWAWLIHTSGLTHSYVTLLLHMWNDACMCATWRIHTCDVSFIRVICLAGHAWHASWGMCHAPHSYAWRDTFIFVTCPMHVCDMTHLYVLNRWVVLVWHSVCYATTNHSCHTYECVTRMNSWHKTTHSSLSIRLINASRHTSERAAHWMSHCRQSRWSECIVGCYKTCVWCRATRAHSSTLG